MSEKIAWISLAHTALLCLAWAYARFLDQGWVHRIYSPDHIWMTVAGGDFLIWPFVAALYWLAFPWWLNAIFYVTLHLAAGAPIIHWQRQRGTMRRREVEAL